MANRLLVTNGVLALPGGPMRATVLCDGARIVAVGREVEDPGAAVLDATGLLVGPGFIDLHVHGSARCSFFELGAGGVASFAQEVVRHGVTAFLVSIAAPSLEGWARLLSASLAVPEGAAEPLGFHAEGPFLSSARRGAFPPGWLRPPDREVLAELFRCAGDALRVITLAPELPGAMELIRLADEFGAVVAIGHTDADFETTVAAFDAGASHVTHLFNAMRPFHHRGGGPVAAALLSGATCELIADGIHVAPEALRVAYRVLGPTRTVLVSDNVPPQGGNPPAAAAEEVVRTAEGTIAGSRVPFDEQFRRAVRFLGIDVSTAFRLASANPARTIRLHHRKGAIERGMDADLTLLDPDLRVIGTICRGQVAYLAEPERLRA